MLFALYLKDCFVNLFPHSIIFVDFLTLLTRFIVSVIDLWMKINSSSLLSLDTTRRPHLYHIGCVGIMDGGDHVRSNHAYNSNDNGQENVTIMGCNFRFY